MMKFERACSNRQAPVYPCTVSNCTSRHLGFGGEPGCPQTFHRLICRPHNQIQAIACSKQAFHACNAAQLY